MSTTNLYVILFQWLRTVLLAARDPQGQSLQAAFRLRPTEPSPLLLPLKPIQRVEYILHDTNQK